MLGRGGLADRPGRRQAIASRLGVPRRLIVIIEGESLVNDASALVIYRVAIVAALRGSFSLPDAGLRFVGVVTGGIAIGLLVGYIVYRLRRPLNNPRAEIALVADDGVLRLHPGRAGRRLRR